jgi:hypothetical protein
MHWLKGKDVVHYFNDNRVIPPWVFNYLLVCIKHDDIVHKIDAAGFRIFVSADFYVSPIPTYTIAQPLLSSPFITTAVFNDDPICHRHTKKQSRLFIDPNVVWQVEFDFAVTVFKESLKDYDIT